MLKLFRRIRKKLIDKGNLKRYLIYSFGEILLVVVGILLAFQVNNWNEERKAGIKEVQILKGLESNLNNNIESIQQNIDEQNSVIRGIERLISHLQNPNSNDSLIRYYQDASFLEHIELSSSTYESLKSSGFEVIGNENIKNKIIELFEIDYSHELASVNSVSPRIGEVGLQLGIKKSHVIIGILTSNSFKKDDTYFELLNFLTVKKQWKNDFVKGQEKLLQKTMKLETEIANYLKK